MKVLEIDEETLKKPPMETVALQNHMESNEE